jgi:hypothetical protein
MTREAKRMTGSSLRVAYLCDPIHRISRLSRGRRMWTIDEWRMPGEQAPSEGYSVVRR